MSDQNPYSPPVADTNAAPIPVPSREGQVTPAMLDHLRGTHPWTKFLAVLGIIGAVLMGLSGLFSMAKCNPARNHGNDALRIGAAIAYLLLAAIYWAGSSKLLSFCRGIQTVLLTGSTRDMENTLERQREFWRFSGIIAIVTLAIMAVLIVAGIVFAAAYRSRAGSSGFSGF